jgi:hypothetical protein
VELATFGQITGRFSPNKFSPFAARISSVVVTWSFLAVKVRTLNAHGVCTISLQSAVHPLSGPHTTTTTTTTTTITTLDYKPIAVKYYYYYCYNIPRSKKKEL